MDEDDLDFFELESLRAGERVELIPDETLICECMCVSAKDIRKFFNNDPNVEVDLDLLKKEFGLGSGCSSCVKSFSQWKNKIF